MITPDSTPDVAIFLPDLRSGGAERLHVSLAKDFVSRGYSVEFVLRVRTGELLTEMVDGITVHELRAQRVRGSLFPLIGYLRRRRPRSFLAAMWPLTVLAPIAAALCGYRGRVVVSEHSLPSLSYRDRGAIHNGLMRASMFIGYRLADACVAVSRGVATDIAALAQLEVGCIEVIHNPAATGRRYPRDGDSRFLLSAKKPVILAVGTLKAVKRLDVLIRAFARLSGLAGTLVIVGDGPERSRLEQLSRELGLEESVLFVGHQVDPGPWYAFADVLVVSSEREGFCNVIVEAMEQGTPVVSTDCPSGPREILEDGRFGVLVEPGDESALADAIESTLLKPHDRSALIRRAAEFGLDRASPAYLGLLLPGPDGGLE